MPPQAALAQRWRDRTCNSADVIIPRPPPRSRVADKSRIKDRMIYSPVEA